MSADTRSLQPLARTRKPWRARLGVLLLLGGVVALGVLLYPSRVPKKADRVVVEEASAPARPDRVPDSHKTVVTEAAKPKQDLREAVVQVEPEPWPPNQWVQLFDGWRRAEGGSFSDQGAVAVTDDGLSLEAPAECMVGVAFAREAPVMDYELRFEMRKDHGRDHAGSVIFPVGDSHCLWAINHGGRDFGLDLVDGKRDGDIGGNRTNRHYTLEDGRWYQCVLRVERRSILAKINIETIVDVQTAGRTFSLWGGFRTAMSLGFLAANGTGVHLRDIRLRRLGVLPPVREPVRELPGAVGDVLLAMDRQDSGAAWEAMLRATAEGRRDEEAARLLEVASRALMQRAVAAGRLLRYTRAAHMAGMAHRLHPETPDIRTVMRWAKEGNAARTQSRFSWSYLDGLKPVHGDWRKQDNELVCRAPARAVIMYHGQSKENFSFEADVVGGHERRSLRFGLFFRSRRGGGRFLYFLLSDAEDRVVVGGGQGEVDAMAPEADGVDVRYAKGRPHYPVVTGMVYHLQVTCVGRRFACYVNDELVAEGTDDDPTDGRLGLLAHQAHAHFDNIVIRRYAPMPELTGDYGDAVKER
ncbi:DUF1080 domain-containing protein [bacterium]|nr:DUF1080 domain-containing protein [bacterium]